MDNPKTVLVSRKFDVDSGSAEWILATHIYDDLKSEGMEVVKLEQKAKSKIFHDWFILPMKCLYYRMKGYNHFYFMSENQATPVICLNLTGANTTSYFHDLMRIQNEKKGLDHHYFTFIYWLASKSKNINVNSTKTATELEDYFGEKITKKVTLLPPFVKRFTADKTNRRYNVIGYLGSLCDRKRPLRLIELAKHLKDKDLDYKIEVWGGGHLKSKMQTMIRQFQLEKYIELKGHAPEAEKEKIYNSFGYFFFPTEKEGFGLPAYESLCCEVPVFILPDADMPHEVRRECVTVKSEKSIIKVIKTFEASGYGK